MASYQLAGAGCDACRPLHFISPIVIRFRAEMLYILNMKRILLTLMLATTIFLTGCAVYTPAPAVVAPAPVIVEPVPVVVIHPAPVFVYPTPLYIGGPRVYVHPHWHR